MKSLTSYINEHKFDRFISNTYPDDPIKSAIYDYVSGYTTSINNELRNNKNYATITDLIDAAFKSKKYSDSTLIDVYRTVDWDYMKNIHGITKENLQDMIGRIIVNKGYMSTSSEFISPWATTWQEDELILHITSDKPYPRIVINDILDPETIDCEDQNEWFLPRNTKLKIISFNVVKGKKYGKSGTYQIELQIIN